MKWGYSLVWYLSSLWISGQLLEINCVAYRGIWNQVVCSNLFSADCVVTFSNVCLREAKLFFFFYCPTFCQAIEDILSEIFIYAGTNLDPQTGHWDDLNIERMKNKWVLTDACTHTQTLIWMFDVLHLAPSSPSSPPSCPVCTALCAGVMLFNAVVWLIPFISLSVLPSVHVHSCSGVINPLFHRAPKWLRCM